MSEIQTQKFPVLGDSPRETYMSEEQIQQMVGCDDKVIVRSEEEIQELRNLSKMPEQSSGFYKVVLMTFFFIVFVVLFEGKS